MSEILAPDGKPRPSEETFDFLDFVEITINRANGRHLVPQNVSDNFWNAKTGLGTTPAEVKKSVTKKYPPGITRLTIGAK